MDIRLIMHKKTTTAANKRVREANQWGNLAKITLLYEAKIFSTWLTNNNTT